MIGHQHPHPAASDCHCIACRPLERPCSCNGCDCLREAKTCENSNDPRGVCSEVFNCCDCGLPWGDGCGCRGCRSCNACEPCRSR